MQEVIEIGISETNDVLNLPEYNVNHTSIIVLACLPMCVACNISITFDQKLGAIIEQGVSS